MFLISFWEFPGLKTWHYVHEKVLIHRFKNTKTSIFIKMDLGVFKIRGGGGGGGGGGYLDLGLFKTGG